MNIAVIGGHRCQKKHYQIAYRLGGLIAEQRWILVCGGREGVMEAACKGAKEKKGLTVGILPGYDSEGANSYLDVKIPTGLGYARNVLVVRAAEGIIAVGGEYGTLSELSFALSEGKKVYGIDTWKIKGVIKVKTPREAIRRIKERIGTEQVVS